MPSYTAKERRKLYRRNRWKRLRRAILERDRWRCQKCGRIAKRPEVHHIRSPFDGAPMFDPDNLRTLCRDCHFLMHAEDIRKRALASMNPERRKWRELIHGA